MARSLAETAAPGGSSNLPTRVQHVSGIAFDALLRAEAVDYCCDALDRHQPVTIGLVNAAKLVHMRSDGVLAESVTGADIVLADGQSVVWASRLLGRPLPERVAGIDLFTDLLSAAEQRGDSVYFLGATDEVLQLMVARVRTDHPELSIAGSRNGYFDLDSDGAAVADVIRASRARLLFVGMSSPRKEIFLSRHGADTGTIVRHGVGGSFDVLAGITRRAPLLMQRLGLEWLFRLLQEPRRLIRRYAVTNTAFIIMIARERLGAADAAAVQRSSQAQGAAIIPMPTSSRRAG